MFKFWSLEPSGIKANKFYKLDNIKKSLNLITEKGKLDYFNNLLENINKYQFNLIF